MSDVGCSRLTACISADMSTYSVVSLAKHNPGMHKVFCRLGTSLAYSMMVIGLGCGGYSQTLGQTLCQAFL